MRPPSSAIFVLLLHCSGTCVADTPSPDLQLPSDELWEDGNLQTISDAIGCPSYSEDGIEDDLGGFSHIPDAETTFNALYRAYHAVIAKDAATLGPSFETDGWKVPISVRFETNVGRGIFADAFIPEGTAVWSPNNAAEFSSVQDFRNFVEYLLLMHPIGMLSSSSSKISSRDLVCDALMWSYTAKKAKDSDDYIICVDFDTGSLLNLADQFDRNIEQDVLVDDIERRHYGCQEGTFYANRDIEKGEELRMYYGDCSEPEGWRKLGLRWSDVA